MEVTELANKVLLENILEVQAPWYIDKVELQKGNKVIDIIVHFIRGSLFPCPVCDKACKVHDSSLQRARHLDLFDYRSYVQVKIPRTNCSTCGIKTIKTNRFFRPGHGYCFVFEKKIMEYVTSMSVRETANLLGEADNNIWNVLHYYVDKAVETQIDFSMLSVLSVDETSFKKGHKYVTTFIDVDNGNVIHVAEGRKEDTMKSLVDAMQKQGVKSEQVETICMDMSTSFISGAKKYFPKSQIAFDRFHIKKLLNDSVDQVRRAETKEREDLKHSRYIWLKDQKNLSPSQTVSLHNFLHDYTCKTSVVYHAKLKFDEIWSLPKSSIITMLEAWIDTSIKIGIGPLTRFANTLASHFDGVSHAIKTGLNNGIAEGFNSVIQSAKRRARGFKTIKNFKAIIFLITNDFNFEFH
jgi:transposase